MTEENLTGSFRLLFLFDVAEAIGLEALRRQLGVAAGRMPLLRHPAPGYVRFAEPPVVQTLAPLALPGEERFNARLSYYGYGVVMLELEAPFNSGWDGLVERAARWMGQSEWERLAQETVHAAVAPAQKHLVKPYESWLSEDYAIVHVAQQPGLTAAALVERHGHQIAQVVRGEAAVFAPEEQAEILQARLSYYPNDLLVVGWSAAFVYDHAEGAASAVELLKYANTQLLDFRHYDELLTRILADVYQRLEKPRGPLMRWRLARDAERLNTVLLDIRELTERMDNSIKFLSDMYDARLYRLAATRVGVPDYRRLVDDKLRTAAELYHFMVDRFQHARAFVLELIVVIVLLIELYFLLAGLRH